MKKIKIGSKNTSDKARVKIHHKGLDRIMAIPLVILVAIGGVITLKFSLADSNVYGVQIVMHDAKANKNIPGIGINFTPYNAGNVACTVMTATTDGAGSASIYGCPSSLGYIANFSNLASIGYEARGQVFGGGTQTITSTNVISGNATQGAYSSYVINIYPIDTDGDGVPNNTTGYPVDKCPSVAGLTSNNGCPAPAPAPAAPAAPQPAAPSGGTTTKKPAPPSSSTSKKTATASNTKSAPAVVAATTGDTSPPTAPENLTISQLDGEMFLSWGESSDNVGVTGYKVERSPDNETWTTLAAKVTDSFYSDSDVSSSDKHYYYRVAALDAAGNSSESILNDIKLVSSSGSKSDSKTKTVVPATKKKTSANLVAGLTLGVVMILAAIVGAFVLMRRHLTKSHSPYLDTDISAAGHAAPATVMTQQPQAGQDPRYNVGPPAEHTAVSLKEMVMENRERHNHEQ